MPNPSGLASDVPLSAHGISQAHELGAHLKILSPAIDKVYASPFYRVLQTLEPGILAINASRPEKLVIHAEHGLGEYFGDADFEQPFAAETAQLRTLFPALDIDDTQTGVIRPRRRGETLPAIHDRFAYCMEHLIRRLDADPAGSKTLLIGTHAAGMISLGRVLTGDMPEDITAAEFNCYVCCLSKFERKGPAAQLQRETKWDPADPDTYPFVDWKGGKGCAGGWKCTLNGDTSFLKDGPERGW